MESVIRDVKDIEPAERHVYESLIGHGLADDQRIVVLILPPDANPDELPSRREREKFFEICKQGTENRERLGMSVEEADLILDEALRAVRAGNVH